MEETFSERRVLLTIEYDGAGFSGWQRQAGYRTVQEEVERALTKLTGKPVTIWGASRTDAGVSAMGQRAHFFNESTIPTQRFPLAVNTFLPPDIRVRAARDVPDGFHARFSSRGKLYTYRIHNSSYACAIRRNSTAHIPVRMDEGKMLSAAQTILGTHDFHGFMAAGAVPKTTVRTIYDVNVTRAGEDVTLTVRGNAFLYNMVRILAGTLAAIGQGRLAPDVLQRALDTGDRLVLGVTAPASGLELTRIYYNIDGERYEENP